MWCQFDIRMYSFWWKLWCWFLTKETNLSCLDLSSSLLVSHNNRYVFLSLSVYFCMFPRSDHSVKTHLVIIEVRKKSRETPTIQPRTWKAKQKGRESFLFERHISSRWGYGVFCKTIFFGNDNWKNFEVKISKFNLARSWISNSSESFFWFYQIKAFISLIKMT